MVQPQSSDPDFIPSAKPAQYPAQFAPVESAALHLIEDDQMQTEWFNGTDRDVILQIHVGTDPKNAIWRKAFHEASPAKRREMESGIRVLIIKSGQSKWIDSEYDYAIQRTRCLHPQCTAKRDSCRDIDHPRAVTSGLAPQLQCKRWKSIPRLDANLDQARAEAEAATAQAGRAHADKLAAEIALQQATQLLEQAQRSAREEREARTRAEENAAKETRARLEAETKLQQAAEAAKAKGK